MSFLLHCLLLLLQLLPLLYSVRKNAPLFSILLLCRCLFECESLLVFFFGVGMEYLSVYCWIVSLCGFIQSLESLILKFVHGFFQSDLKEIVSLLETGAYAREVRRIVRAIRLTMALRRKLKASVLSQFLNLVLPPGSEVHSRLSSFLPKVSRNFTEGMIFIRRMQL